VRTVPVIKPGSVKQPKSAHRLLLGIFGGLAAIQRTMSAVTLLDAKSAKAACCRIEVTFWANSLCHRVRAISYWSRQAFMEVEK
jgi:hypothetical protein